MNSKIGSLFRHFIRSSNEGWSGRLSSVTASPGLYFLGLQWQHTRVSALLACVKHDAAYLADHIARLAKVHTTAATEPTAAVVSEPPPR